MERSFTVEDKLALENWRQFSLWMTSWHPWTVSVDDEKKRVVWDVYEDDSLELCNHYQAFLKGVDAFLSDRKHDVCDWHRGMMILKRMNGENAQKIATGGICKNCTMMLEKAVASVNPPL